MSMVDATRLTPGDTVLEIGPGLGYLTDKLIKTPATVTALEFDQDLIPKLEQKYAAVPGDRLQIIEGDIRTYDLSAMIAGYKICANIPYYLTANLLRRLTDDANKPDIAVLLVQKEVAQKVATSGKMSMLSAIVQSQYHASIGALVSADLFDPAPKVDSQILILERLDESPVPADRWDDYIRLLKIGYSSPRKKLRGNLASGLHIGKEEADALLGQTNVSLDARAEDLTVHDWLQIMIAETKS